MLLTFSIGLVSVNLPLSSIAQSNAISQSGSDKAIQEKVQSQLSSQDNQIVSGASSVLSGNNLNCQKQDNFRISEENCMSGIGTGGGEPNKNRIDINIVIHSTELRPNYPVTVAIYDQDRNFDIKTYTMTTPELTIQQSTSANLQMNIDINTGQSTIRVHPSVSNLSPYTVGCDAIQTIRYTLCAADLTNYKGNILKSEIFLNEGR